MGSTTTEHPPVPEPYWITEGRHHQHGRGWLVGSMAWSTAHWEPTEADAHRWLADLLAAAEAAERRVVK